MDNRLLKQIDFIMEVDKAKDILRRSILTETKRRENDAEHSWHLALMAPILREYIKEELDITKVMNMVIIHDLVEIDAGDTFCYDVKGNEDKREREVKAADRIFNILPKDQAEMIYSLWNEFEDMQTIESRYAATLDRIHPLLLNIATGGESWRENKTTKSMVLKRMAIVEETAPDLWELVLDIINRGIEKGYLLDK